MFCEHTEFVSAKPSRQAPRDLLLEQLGRLVQLHVQQAGTGTPATEAQS
jgi:hypothetical protein